MSPNRPDTSKRSEQVKIDIAREEKLNPEFRLMSQNRLMMLRQEYHELSVKQRSLANKLKNLNDDVKRLAASSSSVSGINAALALERSLTLKMSEINDEVSESDKIRHQLLSIDKQIQPYHSSQYQKYLALLKEKMMLSGANDNDQSEISCLEPNPSKTGRALIRVNVFDNLQKNLNSDWCKEICTKHNLNCSTSEDKSTIQFIEKETNTTINITREKVSVGEVLGDITKVIDTMIEIYLKGIENNSRIHSHMVNGANPDHQNLLEERLAIALRKNYTGVCRINGKPIDDILKQSKNEKSVAEVSDKEMKEGDQNFTFSLRP